MNTPRCVKIVFLTFLYACLSQICIAAQPVSKTLETKPKIEPGIQTKLNTVIQTYQQQLEERAKRYLGRQIDDGRFLLMIKVSLNLNTLVNTARGNSSEKVTLWSLPRQITPEDRIKLFVGKITPESLTEFVENISVEVTFDSTVPEDQVAIFKKILSSSLNLEEARGDKVVVTRANLVAPALTTQLQKIDGEATQLKLLIQQNELEKKSSEIKAKQQEAILLAKINSLEQKIEIEKKQNVGHELKINELKEQVSIYNTPLGEIKKLIKGLELPLTVFPVALLILICSFVFWIFYQASATKRMQTFSEGLRGLSAAIQVSSRSRTASGGNISEIKSLSSEQSLTPASKRTPFNSGIPHVSDDELVELKQEAKIAWESLKKNHYSTLCCLKDWFDDDDGLQRACSFFTAIGQEASKELLSKFSRLDRERILPYLLNQTSRHLGYALVSQVETLIIQEFSIKPAFVKVISPDFLIALNDNEFANIIDESSLQSASLAIISSTSARSARILEIIKNHAPSEILLQIRITAALNASEARLLCEELLEKSRKFLIDDDALVTDQIAAILRNSGPKVQQSIGRIMQADLKLEARIRSATVTFDDVMTLDSDLLSEILEPFASEDLATLLTGLPKGAQDKIASSIGKKLLLEVQAEFYRISSKPVSLRKARSESQKLQAFLIQDLKRLQREGLWEPKRILVTSASETQQNRIEGEINKQNRRTE